MHVAAQSRFHVLQAQDIGVETSLRPPSRPCSSFARIPRERQSLFSTSMGELSLPTIAESTDRPCRFEAAAFFSSRSAAAVSVSKRGGGRSSILDLSESQQIVVDRSRKADGPLDSTFQAHTVSSCCARHRCGLTLIPNRSASALPTSKGIETNWPEYLPETGDGCDISARRSPPWRAGSEIRRSVFDGVLGSEVGTGSFYRLSEGVEAAFAGPPSHEPEASSSDPDRWVNEA